MSAITIRDVPESTLRSLKRKAAGRGKSLQAYLLDLVTRDGATPSLAEMMERLDREADVALSTSDILDAIEGGRERRW